MPGANIGAPAKFVLEFGPTGKADFAGDDELRLGERGDLRRVSAVDGGESSARGRISALYGAEQGLGAFTKVCEIVGA